MENRTFAEIQVGDSARSARTVTREDILAYAAISGDMNPIHVDEDFARENLFHKIVAHGNWAVMLIAALIGMRLPGPGAVFVGQNLNFRRPIGIGDTLAISVTVREKRDPGRKVLLDCCVQNQAGETVIDGTAEVIAPRRKIVLAANAEAAQPAQGSFESAAPSAAGVPAHTS